MEILVRHCSYCGSVEGTKRPIGNYIVKLRKLDDLDQEKLACQSCYINRKRELQKQSESDSVLKRKLIDRLKNIFLF
ncbi:MAG: hypothetical protein ROO71_02020 [Balneola sp.]